MKLAHVVAAGSFALAAASPASACAEDSTIRPQYQHPSYVFDAEPHFSLATPARSTPTTAPPSVFAGRSTSSTTDSFNPSTTAWAWAWASISPADVT